MTRTLLISSLLGGALTIGCTKEDPGTTAGNTTPATSGDEDSKGTTTAPATDSAAEVSNTDGETGNETSAPTTAEVTTGPTSMTNPTTEPGGSSTGCGFICDSTDGGGNTIECDVFAQDCAEGEKCTAWAEGGGSSWNATKCVEVTGDGAPGDDCTTEGGGVSGLDSCQKGAMCWDVGEDNMGLCVELCTGTEAAPECTSGGCTIINNGVLNLCLPSCDPITQDCPGDDLCIPNIANEFVCVLDASGMKGAAFDPCEFANACDKGTFCGNPMAVPMACDPASKGCCLQFCDLENPTCVPPADKPNLELECTAFFEPPMTPPPGLENVGVCVEPGT